MKLKRFIWILLIGSMILGTEACKKGPSNTKKNNKKIKKGKPIPCPIKDC